MKLKIHQGLWHVRFWHNGKEYLRSLKLKGQSNKKPSRLVEAAAQDVVYSVKKGIPNTCVSGEQERISFGFLAQKYVDLHLKLTSKNLKEDNCQLQTVRNFFDSYYLDELNNDLIATYEQKRLEAGIKGSTLNREKAYFRAVLNHASRIRIGGKRIVDRNDTQDIIDSLKFEDESKYIQNRDMTFEEMRNIIFKCPLHVAVALTMQSVTMCRRGEILRAKWCDVRWQRRLLYLGMTKNGTQRYAPLAINFKSCLVNGQYQKGVDTELMKILKVWQAYQKVQHNRYKHNEPENIITFRGKPMKEFLSAFRTARDEAKVQNVRPHTFRHFAVTRLIRIGYSDNDLRPFSGHRDPASFKRYIDYCPDRSNITGLENDMVYDTISCEDFINNFSLEKYRFALEDDEFCGKKLETGYKPDICLSTVN